MKCFLLFTTTMLIANILHAQLVQIKGTIRCNHRGTEATQGAQRVIVKPMFDPSKSVMTSTNPAGYFILNTGLDFENAKESSYTLVLISNCNACDRVSTQHVFIDRPTVVINRWRLEKSCMDTEIPLAKVESYLAQLQKDKPVKEKTPSTVASAGLAAPSFVNLLTEVVTAVTATFPPDGGGKFFANKLGPGKMHYGEFLASSAFYNTSNVGFNFAPDRDVSEAIFWNPAVISTTFKKSNLNAFSNFRDVVKAQLFSKIAPRLSSGFGFLYQNQEEFRTVYFWRPSNNRPDLSKAVVDSIAMKLKEYAIYSSISYAFNKKISAGISLKYVHQNFTVPLRLNRELGNFAYEKKFEYFDSSVTKKGPELDVSFNYNISTAFQVGINFMNLLGSTLHSDAFVPRSDTAAFRSPKLTQFRRVGIGASYKFRRFNLGTDIMLDHESLYEISMGANFIPFNKALIYGGYSFKQNAYSFGFRLSYFRIGYINDNGYMINDVKRPKNSFFDGRIYGGLVIDGWDSN